MSVNILALHVPCVASQQIPLTSTSSSDLMDAVAVSDVLMAKSACSSELSHSMSVELRSRRSSVLKHRSASSSICPEIHCSSPANLTSALVRTRLALKDQAGYSEWFPVYFVSALKAPPSVTGFLKSGTKRWRRIHRVCPQLLDRNF